MDTAIISKTQYESVSADHKGLLSWKAAFGGLLISLMVFVTLTALGAGVAGFTAESLISNESGGYGFATGAGLYLGLSVVIALFCGSFFTLRISRFVTTRVGVAHGLIVASAFFLLMLLGLGNVIGGLAHGFGNLTKASGAGLIDIASNLEVQDTLNQSLGSWTIKSDPKDFAQGLTIRLLQGDTNSAKKYLAYQTGLTETEVDSKIAELKTQFDVAAKNATTKAAHAVGDAGLSFFVIFLVGLIGAGIGGQIGAHSNVKRPISTSPSVTSTGFAPLHTEQGSIVPYIFGWLLGVPVSILLLIAMFRVIF